MRDEDEMTRDPSALSRRLWLGGVALASTGLGWGVWYSRQARRLEASVEQALWATALEQPEGALLRLESLRGRPLVLNFWATWCTPCVEEMPLLDAFYRENKSKGWQVLGLAVDQPSSVKRFLNQFGFAYPMALAGLQGTELMRLLGNTQGGLPFTLVLNADGSILTRKLGKLSANDLTAWA